MQKTQSPTHPLPLSYLLNLQHKHWYHNNRISTTINYQICKKLMVNATFDLIKYKKQIEQIDQFLQLVLRVGTMRDIVIQWLTCIIFNIVAINDQYREQVQHSFSISYSNKSINNQVSIQILNTLQQLRSQSLKILFNLHSILQLIKQFPSTIKSNSHHYHHELQYTFLSTINYISKRLQIPLQYQQNLQQKINQLTQCNCNCYDYQLQENIRIKINQVIFGENDKQQYDIKKLQNLLKKNYNLGLNNIVSLIDANYYNFENDNNRELFKDCKYNGLQIIKKFINSFIIQYNKNQLFSQKMLEIDRIFQLFMSVIEFRYLNVYANWCYILQKYFKNQLQFKIKQQGIIKQICNFLYSLPIQHQQYVDILKIISEDLYLKCKYSQNIILQIIKKFILNRFLLNPIIFYLYTDLQIKQEHLSNIFNKIRLYFYPKKIQNQSQIIYSQKIQSILSSIIFNSKQNLMKNKIEQSCKKQNNNQNKKIAVYQLDRTLYHDYQNIYSDLFQPYFQQNKGKKQASVYNNSYQLSFSFVKNNISKDYQQIQKKIKTLNNIEQTPRAKTQIAQENLSINTVNALSKTKNKNINNLVSPRSQKSRKTDITDVPAKVENDLSMIQQLVAKRRALGNARRAINHRISKRAEQRQKLSYFYNKVHKDFQKVRRQIQSSANKVRIQIELI